jgi:hypothetical protein
MRPGGSAIPEQQTGGDGGVRMVGQSSRLRGCLRERGPVREISSNKVVRSCGI